MTLFFYFSFESSKLRFQDLDLFAKKVEFLLRKSPELTPDGRRTASGFGRKLNWFFCIQFIAATRTMGIFMSDYLKSSYRRNSTFS